MKKRDESATAAVEFAPVLPVLVAFLFGIVAFGVIFGQDLAVETLPVRPHGSVVMEGRTWADLMREIDDSLDTIGSDDSGDLTVVSRDGGCARGGEGARTGAAEGDSIRVVVTYRPSPTSEGES